MAASSLHVGRGVRRIMLKPTPGRPLSEVVSPSAFVTGQPPGRLATPQARARRQGRPVDPIPSRGEVGTRSTGRYPYRNTCRPR